PERGGGARADFPISDRQASGAAPAQAGVRVDARCGGGLARRVWLRAHRSGVGASSKRVPAAPGGRAAAGSAPAPRGAARDASPEKVASAADARRPSAPPAGADGASSSRASAGGPSAGAGEAGGADADATRAETGESHAR